MEEVRLREGQLFSIKDLVYLPEAPRKNDSFTVRGKVELFGLPFLAPVWVIGTVTYPESWWEEIIPIIGAPEARESKMVIGGDFELTFSTGFIREGEYKLAVRVYIGPTIPIDKIVLPPAPAFATGETTFMVAGEAPPQEANFRNFRIVSYSKGAETPIIPPGVLDLNVGDVCRVNVAFDHTGPAVTGKLYSAIWYKSLLDPRNEVLKAEKSISVPVTTNWISYSTGYYVDIPITSAISKGTYGLYAKIRGITGGDILSPFLENVITIAGGGPVVEWTLVQEIAGITVLPEAVAPPAAWTLVQEIAGITVAPEAVAPPPTEPVVTDLTIVSPIKSTWIGGGIYITIMFKYEGPAITGQLYAAIGNNQWWGFDEVWKSGWATLPIAAATSGFKETRLGSIWVEIVGGSPGTYDLYAKLSVPGLADVVTPIYLGTITITL